MNVFNNIIKGKQVNKFPVYLKKEDDPTYAIVVTNLNDVSRLPKGSTWVNAGTAPGDRNRAVLGDTPTSSISVSKTFQVHRIVAREGNTFKLFPENTFSPSVTWIQSNRPRVGGYLLRHDNDYYTAMTDKTFDRHYGKNLAAEDRRAFKEALEIEEDKELAGAVEEREANPERSVSSVDIESLSEPEVEEIGIAVIESESDAVEENVGNC
jgi:hypothetical protein